MTKEIAQVVSFVTFTIGLEASRKISNMFHPVSCHKDGLKATNSKSNPGRTQTSMQDDFLVDTEPVAFDWNMVMDKPDKPVQRPVYLPDTEDDVQPEKPRRALSAYNIFFQHQREPIKKELAEASLIMEDQQISKKTHRGKMLFAALARTVSTRWKKIDKETRAPYDELAARDKKRYEREMKEWRYLQSSILHQIQAGNAFGSVKEASFHNITVGIGCCDIEQCGIQSLQLNKSFWETSSMPSEQYTGTSKTQPSMIQCQNTFTSAEQTSTAREVLNTFVTPEELPHSFCANEISGADRLQELAESLGNERLELLLQIFGTRSQEDQNLSF